MSKYFDGNGQVGASPPQIAKGRGKVVQQIDDVRYVYQAEDGSKFTAFDAQKIYADSDTRLDGEVNAEVDAFAPAFVGALMSNPRMIRTKNISYKYAQRQNYRLNVVATVSQNGTNLDEVEIAYTGFGGVQKAAVGVGYKLQASVTDPVYHLPIEVTVTDTGEATIGGQTYPTFTAKVSRPDLVENNVFNGSSEIFPDNSKVAFGVELRNGNCVELNTVSTYNAPVEVSAQMGSYQASFEYRTDINQVANGTLANLSPLLYYQDFTSNGTGLEYVEGTHKGAALILMDRAFQAELRKIYQRMAIQYMFSRGNSNPNLGPYQDAPGVLSQVPAENYYFVPASQFDMDRLTEIVSGLYHLNPNAAMTNKVFIGSQANRVMQTNTRKNHTVHRQEPFQDTIEGARRDVRYLSNQYAGIVDANGVQFEFFTEYDFDNPEVYPDQSIINPRLSRLADMVIVWGDTTTMANEISVDPINGPISEMRSVETFIQCDPSGKPFWFNPVVEGPTLYDGYGVQHPPYSEVINFSTDRQVFMEYRFMPQLVLPNALAVIWLV